MTPTTTDERTQGFRLIALVAVVLLVAVAGCSGGGGATTPTETDDAPADTDTSTDELTTPAETDRAGTETPGESTDDGSDGAADTVTATDGPDESGALSADAGVTHVEALREAGSFTVDTHTEFTNESGAVLVSNTTSRIDVDAERGYQNSTVSLDAQGTFSSATYTTADTTYQRVSTFGQTQYRTATVPYDQAQISPVDFSTVVGDVDRNFSRMDVQFERVGTATIDGVSATRYRATGEDLAGLWNTSQTEDATVTGAEMTVAVDDQGLFRHYNLTMDVETQDGEQAALTVEQQFSAVGNTTVEEPGWLEEARTQTE